MRQLGEQWIENGRMYKVVLPGLCDGCDFNMGCLQNGGVNCKAGHCVTKQGHVKDLGPVNEDGCLPAPWDSTKYPKITVLIGNVYNIEVMDGFWFMQVRGNTLEKAIERWNRRAM